MWGFTYTHHSNVLCVHQISCFFSEITCNLRVVFSLKRADCMFLIPTASMWWYPSGSSPSTGRRRSSLCSTLRQGDKSWSCDKSWWPWGDSSAFSTHPSSHGPGVLFRRRSHSWGLGGTWSQLSPPASSWPVDCPPGLAFPALSAGMDWPLAAHCATVGLGSATCACVVRVGPPTHLWNHRKQTNCLKNAVSAVRGCFDF